MREYKVFMKDPNTAPVQVHAADVNVESTDVAVFFNFVTEPDEDDACVTVAAVPFDEVRYITS
jgi:hypothetical protein